MADFFSTYGFIIWPALSALFTLALAAMAKSGNPRVQAAYHLVASLGIDVPKLIDALKTLVSKAAPPRTPVQIEFRVNVPPSAESDEVTWPKGPPTPRNDRPRGVAQVRVLAVLAMLTAIPLSPAVHLAGCAWLSAKAPVVKRVVKAVTGACTGYAIVVPEVGPVCLVLAQVDQILEDVLAAKRDGVAYHLTVEIDGVERSVTIPPEQLAAFASHVGQVSSAGHAAPAASGSAVPR